MAALSRKALYEVYQKNISTLEKEMELVKSTVQSKLGEKLYLEELYEKRKNNSKDALNMLNKLENEVLAATRLYTFLLCSWLEIRLNKIMYEASSVAFTDAEREIVRFSLDKNGKRVIERKMESKWKVCFNYALCKGFGIINPDENKLIIKSPDLFTAQSFDTAMYDRIFKYIDKIQGAITVRNRLAHGQWSIQLNSKSTSYASGEVVDFMTKYDNIMKLELLFKMFREIADIISSYVTYKERNTKKKTGFETLQNKRIKSIDDYNIKLDNMKFNNYCKPLLNNEKKRREKLKKLFN